MRTEPCVCGGSLRAPSVYQSRAVVEAHNRSLLHMAWRLRVGIITPDMYGAQPDDPRRHWPTAEASDVDLSDETPGASTDGVEGAA